MKASNLIFLYITSRWVCVLSTVAVIVAVFWDFLKYNRRDDFVIEKKSLVATGTMFLFFFVFYVVVVLQVGVVILPWYIYGILCVIGAGLLAIGAIVNILGRVSLGRRWSDHIKVYRDHSLVTVGVYRIVRHPLYASLIWMFYGASFVYSNWIAFLLTSFVFVPMMYYRAKEEENVLMERFPEYKAYMERVGMFIPRIF